MVINLSRNNSYIIYNRITSFKAIQLSARYTSH